MWDDDTFERPPWYDLMQVCESGHIITAYGKSNPEDLRKRCGLCGKATQTSCAKCSAEIPGYKHITGVFYSAPDTPPEFCENCGTGFPWSKIKEAPSKKVEEKPLERIEKILRKFHTVAKHLRARYKKRETLSVTDEYDVQDLLNALLRIDFNDVRAEEWTPSYAGGSSRMDFLLKDEKVVIEVKKTRNTLGDTELGEQLIVDIEKYQHHPDCKTLICFTYDPEGLIGNPAAVKNDLEKKSTDKLKIKVYIFPDH